MKQDEQNDVEILLRDAFARLPDTRRIETSVKKRIAEESSRRWIAVFAAAAMFVACMGYFIASRAPIPRLFADAARDHRVEVLERKPRRWRSSEAEVAALARQFHLPDTAIAELAPAGYRLEHAKTCGLEGHPVLHLVYADGAREFSMYVSPRGKSALPYGAVTVGAERVAAMQTADFDTLIVTNGSSADCLTLAKRAGTII